MLEETVALAHSVLDKARSITRLDISFHRAKSSHTEAKR